MKEITLEAFNSMKASRKSNTEAIVKTIVESLAKVKAGAVAQFTAQELYGKEAKHYFSLRKALNSSKEYQAMAKEDKFLMDAEKHGNFNSLAIVRK